MGFERAVEQVFREAVAGRLPREAGPRTVLLGVSGGLDSMVLLDLFLRFGEVLGCTPVAAHFDHAMRPGSADDAAWVRSACADRGVPIEHERADPPPGSETAARDARAGFLTRAAERAGAWRIATAHHADDQAETVLFRIARGTGIDGLAGMEVDSGHTLRPLLDLFRSDLEDYARRRELEWREDPTNQDRSFARNLLRHEVIPLLERGVAPAARHSLVRLARHAREARRSGQDPYDCLHVVDARAVVVARERFSGYDRAAQARAVRLALRIFGVVTSASGTRAAIEFITDAASGRELHLAGGVRLFSELDTARFERTEKAAPDVSFRFVSPQDRSGGRSLSGLARLGGRAWAVSVVPGAAATRSTGRTVAVPLHAAPGPFEVRAWRDGDRIVLSGGTRKLKEIWREMRIPRRERSTMPVLTDAEDSVLWVMGGPSSAALEQAGEVAFTLTIEDD